MVMKFPIHKPTPRNMRRVICDQCGQEYRLKDVTKVTNKYNRQYGLIVCRSCKDLPNDQDRPITGKEIITSQPEMVRPRQEPTYVTNANDDRAPSAPTITKIVAVDGVVTLYWDGPSDPGSSGITGYAIVRANPQLGIESTVTSDTGASHLWYADSSATLTTDYTYRVAAINSFGTGTYSDYGFYPTKNVPADIVYLTTGGTILQTSQGDAIVLSPDI